MAYIENHDGVPVLRHLVIDDQEYAFSVKDFPEEKRAWLCQVVGAILDEVHDNAVKSAEAKIKAKIRSALGIQH